MNIDKKIQKEQIKLQELKTKKFANRLAGKFVVFAGIYNHWNKSTHTYKTYYNYYLNPRRALIAYHKKAQHLINVGVANITPIKSYPHYTFHKIGWAMAYTNPLSCRDFLFTRNEAKQFSANSPYPSILFNAIQPATEAHPNDLFFKKSIPSQQLRYHQHDNSVYASNNGYNIAGEKQY